MKLEFELSLGKDVLKNPIQWHWYHIFFTFTALKNDV